MALILLVLIIVKAICKECPSWECSQIDVKGCLKVNKEKNQVLASIHNNSECSIFDYFFDFNEDMKLLENYLIKSEKLAFYGFLLREFCEGKDFSKILKCEEYCTWNSEQKINLWPDEQQDQYGRNCDFQKFQKNQKHNENGLIDFSLCESDDQCASQRCQCVPSTQKLARCTSSVLDSIWEQFFSEVCEVYISNKLKSCELYVQVNLAHILYQLKENEQIPELECLKEFGDASSVLFKLDVSSFEYVKYIIGGVLILTVIFLIFYIRCQKTRHSEIQTAETQYYEF